MEIIINIPEWVMSPTIAIIGFWVAVLSLEKIVDIRSKYSLHKREFG